MLAQERDELVVRGRVDDRVLGEPAQVAGHRAPVGLVGEQELAERGRVRVAGDEGGFYAAYQYSGGESWKATASYHRPRSVCPFREVGRQPIRVSTAMAMTARTLVQRYLMGKFPASRAELMDRARRQGADQGVVVLVGRLPEGRFESAVDVEHALGHERRDERRDRR